MWGTHVTKQAPWAASECSDSYLHMSRDDLILASQHCTLLRSSACIQNMDKSRVALTAHAFRRYNQEEVKPLLSLWCDGYEIAHVLLDRDRWLDFE
jgi:hypothetical protein